MANDSSVLQVQNLLNRHGYQLDVDGVLGPQTKAAIQDFQRKVGLPINGLASRQTLNALFALPPMPNMRPTITGDAMGTGQTGMPLPQMRPPPEVLGSGNTNVMPRLRQDAMAAIQPPPPNIPPPDAQPPQQAMPPQASGDVQTNPAWNNIPPARQFDMNYGRTFEAIDRYHTPTDQGGMGMRGLPPQWDAPPPQTAQATPPPQVGQMVPGGFNQRWDNASPPMTPPAMIPPQGQAQAQQGAPQPPPFQPSPDNQGYGMPGMPRRGSFLEATGDVFGAAGGAIGGLINNLTGSKSQASDRSQGNPKIDDALQIVIQRDLMRRRLADELKARQAIPFGAPGMSGQPDPAMMDLFYKALSTAHIDPRPQQFLKQDDSATGTQQGLPLVYP